MKNVLLSAEMTVTAARKSMLCCVLPENYALKLEELKIQEELKLSR